MPKFQKYSYQKAYTSPVPAAPSNDKRSLSRIVPSILITVGSLLIANVTWPIISYQLFTAPQIQKAEFVSPIPKSQLGNAPVALPTPSPHSSAPQVMGAATDYSNPQNWFPTADYTPPTKVQSYTIDIPDIDIHKAKVIVGGEDLDRSLVHYPGTASPGQLGSPVIFGHSVLRQFYQPQIDNLNRYNSIFSKIMTLESGDYIFVDYDGIRYTYEVKDKVQVQPEDLFILEQRYNNRELKLITCVPEGTYLRRGVIIAKLVNLNPAQYYDLE